MSDISVVDAETRRVRRFLLSHAVTLLDECFRIVERKTWYIDTSAIQHDLGAAIRAIRPFPGEPVQPRWAAPSRSDPKFRITDVASTTPLRRSEDLARYARGLGARLPD